MSIKTLGMLANPMKEGTLAIGKRAMEACDRFGLRALPGPGLFACKNQEVPMDVLLKEADALLVIGGDGTILHSIGLMGDTPLPILGINSGTLGFLAECTPEAVERAIAALAAGAYTLEERMLLSARMSGDETRYTALNDIVVSRGHFSRTLRVEVYVDGSLASAYTGDGCIIASPTGSTAYALASGGPIVSPALSCFVITPICPHTLSSRTMVVPAGANLRLTLSPRTGEDGGIVFAVDGSKRRVLHEPAELTVQRGAQNLSFIRVGKETFFTLLRQKLVQWVE